MTIKAKVALPANAKVLRESSTMSTNAAGPEIGCKSHEARRPPLTIDLRDYIVLISDSYRVHIGFIS